MIVGKLDVNKQSSPQLVAVVFVLNCEIFFKRQRMTSTRNVALRIFVFLSDVISYPEQAREIFGIHRYVKHVFARYLHVIPLAEISGGGEKRNQ